MTKMVEARHFYLHVDDKKKASKQNPKKGAAFVAVENESKS